MRMNLIRSFLAVLCFAVLTSIVVKAYAGSGVGTVAVITVNDNGSGLTRVTFNASSGFPALGCSTNPKSFLLASPATDLGKSQLSVLTAALLSGKTVAVIGTGACTNIAQGGIGFENLVTVSLVQ